MRRIFVLLSVIALVTSALSLPAGAVAGFGDVRAADYWARGVQWMVDNDITTGTGPGCFSPEDPVTRGQAAAFVWRMEGRPESDLDRPFVDVTLEWQLDAVAWMLDEGITTGTAPLRFSPESVLTRGQLAAILYRLAGEPPAGTHPFADVSLPWQQDPVAWMAAEDITTGTSQTTFSPDNVVTRGQLATFFYRYKGQPHVTLDAASPQCGGINPPPGDPGEDDGDGDGDGDNPPPDDPPADCSVRADEAWSVVWFDLYYNPNTSSCDRPEFEGSGSTFIVDRDHPSASDSNPGTASLPWRTIVHAAETADTGDIVYVKAGVYDDGRIEPRTSGVIFSAFPGDEHEAIIEGWGIRVRFASDVILHGFQLRNIENNALQAMGPGADNIVIANNSTYNTDYSGVSIRGNSPGTSSYDAAGIVDVLIIGNDIRRANMVSSEVISVGSGVVRAHVVANELSDGDPSMSGGDEGIAFKNGVADSKIYGNDIHDLSDRGIHIDGGDAGWNALVTNIEIFDNLIYDNANQGMWAAPEGDGDIDGVHVHHNIAYNNAADGFSVYDHPDGAESGGTVDNVVFEFNTAVGNGGSNTGYGGFAHNHERATGIVFRNNIAWGNTGIGFDVEPTTIIDHNLCGESNCEIRSNPLFVNDPTDLRLTAGSPAIGAASDGSNLGAN
ncbi:MAG: hypothetical protein DHS20C19_06760 [Acidimicrobiales bacterium]|nr:MAG: hypothetical protein DHS20C19_06760 [Acidimicrobiales bacterium]